MGNTTSVHIKPCKVGTSRAHNMRTAEYMANIPSDRTYIRTDLTPDNESWLAECVRDKSLSEYFDELVQLYTDKVKQRPQLKPRERKNAKTGKVTVIEGWSPLREDTVIVTADTTMEQLQEYARRCHERFGVHAIEIHIHKDEGHCAMPGDLSTFKHNYHAHVVWDWVNHQTGKTYKLNADDMSTMQDIAAECLQMERGRSKAETGAVHLERTDFIISKQKRETEEAVRRQTEAELKQSQAERRANHAEHERALAEMYRDMAKSTVDQLNVSIGEKRKAAAELDHLIADKRNKAMSSGESLAVEDLKERLGWRNDAIRSLGSFLYRAMPLFHKAIDTIVTYAKNVYNVFDADEASTIKDTIDVLAPNDNDKASVVNFLLVTADHQANLTDTEFRKAQCEVEDVAKGCYDTKISHSGTLHR